MVGEESQPLNIEPIAPSLENILPPVPVVFSPAAGYPMSVLFSEHIRDSTHGDDTYSLVDGLVDATCKVLILQSAVGAGLEGLGSAVSVHDA